MRSFVQTKKTIMKLLQAKFLCLMAMLLMSSVHLFSQSQDELAVKETALNYIEGWYTADSARMATALSVELVKKGFLLNQRTGKLSIAPATYAQMVQWAGNKPNEMAKNPDILLEVHIIEVGENIAMVKTIAPDFIDYLHMGKMNGEWKIYHAIWEPNKSQ